MTDSGRWEGSWEVTMPVRRAVDLLTGLVTRDLVHGSSFDVELEDGAELAVDLLAGDELEDDGYRLMVTAEVEGPRRTTEVSEVVLEALEEAVEEARRLVERRSGLGSVRRSEVEMRPVAEDAERWDLVVPDWLAPDGAVVPFGFRPFRARDGSPWPDDADLDRHGRVVLVPEGSRLVAYGVPAPEATPGDSGELPVLP